MRNIKMRNIKMRNIKRRTVSFIMIILVVVTTVFGNAGLVVQAEGVTTLAGWSYAAAPESGLPASATSGSGTLSVTGANFTGYSSSSLCANTWTLGGGWVISLDSTNYKDLTFSANMRSSGTGPGKFDLEYSIDNGSTWTIIDNSQITIGSTSLSGVYNGLVLPEALNGTAFLLRVTANELMTQGGKTVESFGTSGTSNINHIVITGINTSDTGEPPVTEESCGVVTATPVSGEVASGTTISLTCSTENATIYYNTDGTENYSVYTDAITITEDTTIYAYSNKEGYKGSEKQIFPYTVAKDTEEPGEPIEEENPGTSVTATHSDGLSNGDVVAVYYDNGKMVLSSTASDNRLTGISVEPVSGSITVPDGTATLTVSIDENGYYTFISDGKYLTAGPTGSSLTLADTASDYSLWALETAGNGFRIVSVNAKYVTKTQYLEYYKGFTTYSYNANNDALYIYNFYKISSGAPVENEDTVDTSVIFNVAQWAGNADYSGITGTNIYGDLYVSNDLKDSSALYTAVISGTNVKPYTSTKSSTSGTSYYMGATGVGSGTNDYLQFELVSLGYGEMDMSLRMRASNTGPGSFQLQYSTDGTTFTNFTTGTYAYSYTKYDSAGVSSNVNDSGNITDGIAKTSFAPGNYVSFTFDVPKETENADKLYIRLVPGTEAAKSGSTLGSSGTIRVDSVKITGSPVVSNAICGYVSANPAEGKVDIGSELTLTSATKDAVISYSFDGENYSNYDEANKPVFTALPATVRVYAIKAGLTDSIKTIYTYTQNQCEAVKATPNGGSVTRNSKMTLRSQTEGATILYAYVSGEDTSDSSLVWNTYDGPIVLSQFPVTFKVKAVKDGYLESAVSTITFTEKTNEKYNIYFGQIHGHTSYSDGAGSIGEAFDYATKIDNLDFLAITDHSNSLDNASESILTKNVDTNETDEWTQGHLLAEKYSSDEFTCLYGYEMTWSNGLGHINTFNTEGFQSRNQAPYTTYSTALQNYYAALKTAPDSISQFNHPGTTFGDFNDFAYYDKEIDNIMTLIEVGNGEGPIRSSGYFPSYEYYTRALDKGWHVAPSNNQDNHKGKWGDANTARTVILADSNTEENIYDAMRNYRVYATEDNNLSIYYTLDNYIMGTILEEDQVGDTVSLNVNLADKDKEDQIGKVEVIVNGGLSIASKTITNNEAIVSFDVPASYSYYYIKITQADKDIAVTAPVWVGEVEACGISSISTTTSLPVQGEALDVNLGLYNNEDTDLIINSIDFTIGEQVVKSVSREELEANNISTISSKGTGTYSFDYTYNDAGSVVIQAIVTARLNGTTKVYKDSLSLTYVKPEMVTNVIIDGTHYNDYVTGYYGGSMGSFIKICADNNIKATIEKNKITKEMLEDCDLLVISAPAKKTGTATVGSYVPSHFSDEFMQLISEYMKNGGSIILCGIADYQDSKNGQTSTEMNKLLNAIGSNIILYSDEVYDEVNNGGQNYRLYLENFNMESEYLSGVAEGQKYSLYSGCSVNLTNAIENDFVYKAVPLVKGFDTTYSIDSKDGDGNNCPTPNAFVVEKGDVIGLASQSTKAGGNIIVAGTVFMSDFEVDAEIDNSTSLPYANYNIICNILDKVSVKIPTSTIAQARKGMNGDVYAVEGYVTSGTSNSYTTFFDTIYIQDDTAGINIFPYAEEGLEIGTKIRIVGYVAEYQGDRELKVISWEKLEDKPVILEPKVLNTKDAMDYDVYGGSLIKTKGVVKRVEYTTDGAGVAEFWIADDTGKEAAVFIDGYIYSGTTGKNELASAVKKGANISAIGILYMHPEGDAGENVPVLRVRNCDEILLQKSNNNDNTDKDNDDDTKSENTPQENNTGKTENVTDKNSTSGSGSTAGNSNTSENTSTTNKSRIKPLANGLLTQRQKLNEAEIDDDKNEEEVVSESDTDEVTSDTTGSENENASDSDGTSSNSETTEDYDSSEKRTNIPATILIVAIGGTTATAGIAGIWRLLRKKKFL